MRPPVKPSTNQIPIGSRVVFVYPKAFAGGILGSGKFLNFLQETPSKADEVVFAGLDGLSTTMLVDTGNLIRLVKAKARSQQLNRNLSNHSPSKRARL